MGQNKPTRYEKLGAIDAKCGALLQLTSLLLVFISLAPVQNKFLTQTYYKVLVFELLISCLLQLYVLWFKEEPNEAFIARRKWIFNAAVALTFAACVAVVVLVAAALFWQDQP